MGRCFGFAFGHKENGAMFSHMAVMYAYALYKRGYARQAYRALESYLPAKREISSQSDVSGYPRVFHPPRDEVSTPT